MRRSYAIRAAIFLAWFLLILLALLVLFGVGVGVASALFAQSGSATGKTAEAFARATVAANQLWFLLSALGLAALGAWTRVLPGFRRAAEQALDQPR